MLSLLLLFSLAAPPQAPDKPLPADAPPPRPVMEHFTSGFGAAEIDGRLAAFSPRTTTRFDADGVTVIPVLGQAAPRDLPVHLALVDVARDGGGLALARGVAPELAGARRVVYARGAGVLERWEARREGVELSFVLEALPPGGGDLVIGLALETELLVPYGSHAARAELVEPGLGGVFVDAPIAIDARGARAAGTTRLAPGRLELVIPADFLAQAALPLVVDPLFGGLILIDPADTKADGSGDADWDPTTGVWCVTWLRTSSAGNISAMVQRLDASGQLLGGPAALTVDTAAQAFSTAVGSVASSGRFLVAWHEFKYVPPLSFISKLWARAVRASDGGLSSAVLVTDVVTTPVHVSGEVLAPHDRALVVFGLDKSVLAYSVQLTPSGTPILQSSTVVGSAFAGAGTVADVDVSRNGGVDGRHLVAWTMAETLLTNEFNPWCRAVSRTAALLGQPLQLSSYLNEEMDIDVDGDGRDWIAAWDFEYTPGDRDVHVSHVTWNAGLFALVGGTQANLQEGFNDEAAPQVAWCGNKAFLASSEQYLLTNDYDVAVLGVDPVTLMVCEPETFPAYTGESEVPTAFTTSWSSSTPSSWRSLCLWDRKDLFTSDTDVVGAFWDTYGPGVPPVDLGGGCGSAGALTALANPVIGLPSFGFKLTGAPAGASTAVLLVGPPQAPYSCGGCSLLISSWIQQAVPIVGGSATVPLLIPCQPLLTGAQVQAQFAVLPVPTVPCPLFFGVGASNRLALTLSN